MDTVEYRMVNCSGTVDNIGHNLFISGRGTVHNVRLVIRRDTVDDAGYQMVIRRCILDAVGYSFVIRRDSVNNVH